MEVAADEQVLAGIPSWCRLLVLVPVVAALLALLGGGGRDPFTVLIWVVWPMVAFGVWVTVDTVQTATSPAGDW